MTATEYLNRVKKIDRMISNKLTEHRHWESVASDLGGVALGDRVQTSRNLHRGADAIGKYIDIEAEIHELQQERQEIIATIERLPSDEYDVIYRFYIQDYGIKEIAYQKHRSNRWVRYKKEDGLKFLQSILDGKGVAECENRAN